MRGETELGILMNMHWLGNGGGNESKWKSGQLHGSEHYCSSN